MARKIFVSYKHKDASVRPLNNILGQPIPTTARHYVEELIAIIGRENIYKGEGNEDLSAFKDETIRTKLKEKIFDSSVTIVLLSKNMREWDKNEEDQWIPWEISYSLREKRNGEKVSKPNAMLAVVLPDEMSSYYYFVRSTGCSHCNTTQWMIDDLFTVMRTNMFNKKSPQKRTCATGVCGPDIHLDEDHSYIHPVLWDDFVYNPNKYIEHAVTVRDKIHEYDIRKVVN